jgi:hypothetical protein
MKPCCQDPANLEPRASDVPGEVVQVCRVCGCRHFGITIDTMTIGLREPEPPRRE